MKNTRIFRASCATALPTAVLLALAAHSRADLVYKVTLAIDQADLVSSVGPFSLDLQLSAGAGTNLNTVSLTNFVVTGGSFTAGTEGNSGNVTGSLLDATPSLTLSNGVGTTPQLDNEDWVAFGPGVTSISFTVDETTRTENGAPDAFAVGLLDTNLNFISTTSSADNQALVYGTSDMSSIATLNSDKGNSSDAGGATPSVAVVPEPGSAALLLLGVAGFVARRKRSAGTQIA